MKRILTRIHTLMASRRFDPRSGQVFVLLALSAVGLVAIMGLAIDGGRLLFLRRDTQNAADAAAIAAARALCTARDPAPYALSAADANGFDNDRVDNWVDVFAPPQNAGFTITNDCSGCFVEIEVRAEIPPTFIQLVYGGDLIAEGRAIGACNPDLNGVANRAPQLRAIWAMSDSCSPLPVTITGSDIEVQGGLHSNGDMKIMPSQGGGTVIGATSAVVPYKSDEIVQGQSKISWSAGSGAGGSTNPHQTSTGTCLPSCFDNLDTSGIDVIPADGKPYLTTKKTSYPVDFKIEDFQKPNGKYYLEASAKGEYYEFSCSGKFWDWVMAKASGGKLADGIYYANCDLDITKDADNITGKVTFVTTGTITVKGDGQQWQPYTDNLIMFANSNEGCNGPGAVKFSGNHNSWNGIIFAPRGSIKMSASTNDSTSGCLVGLSVELSGARNKIICDTSTSASDPIPGMWLEQ